MPPAVPGERATCFDMLYSLPLHLVQWGFQMSPLNGLREKHPLEVESGKVTEEQTSDQMSHFSWAGSPPPSIDGTSGNTALIINYLWSPAQWWQEAKWVRGDGRNHWEWCPIAQVLIPKPSVLGKAVATKWNLKASPSCEGELASLCCQLKFVLIKIDLIQCNHTKYCIILKYKCKIQPRRFKVTLLLFKYFYFNIFKCYFLMMCMCVLAHQWRSQGQ